MSNVGSADEPVMVALSEAVVWYSWRAPIYKEGEMGENAYGLVTAQMSNGQIGSVICGHGGSMWLCRNCADSIIRNNGGSTFLPYKKQETGIERYWREQEEAQ